MSVSRRTLLGAGAIGLPLLAARRAPAREPFRIFVVQWRGETQEERGMRAYLANVGLAAKFTVRDAGQDHGRLPPILAEVRDSRPDLVFVFGTEATLGIAGPQGSPPAAYLGDLPCVFANVGDPVGTNLVGDLAHAGRNLTGVIHLPPLKVQFDALIAFFAPRRVGVFYNAAEIYGARVAQLLQRLADAAGIVLAAHSCNGADGMPDAGSFEPSMQKFHDAQVDVVYLPSTSFFIPQARRITEAAVSFGLPTFCASEQLIRNGEGLAGLIAPPEQVGAFAGYKIEQILLGGLAARDIPIEALPRFALLINMPVSLRLGVYPPVTMLRYAEIIRAS